MIDGFLYIENGDYIPFDANSLDAETVEVGTPYVGPGTNDYGMINDVYAYVTNRYPGYDFVDSEYLNATFECFNQDEFTVYRYNGVGEGNCALSSVYALLNYLGTSRQCSFPPFSSKQVCYPQNDPFYLSYYGVSGYEIPYSVTLPKLYYTVRHVAIEDYGYERNGFNTIAIPGLIEAVADDYSNDIAATLYLIGTFDSCVVPALERDTPTILVVSGSAVYGEHALVVTGYRIYRETTTVLGINFYEYFYILRVSDNWGTSARFFDLKDYGGSTQYVTVEVTS